MGGTSFASGLLRTATLSVLMLSTGLALPVFQKLHVFTQTCPHGPKGVLLNDGSGGFYGTSSAGGSHGKGTVYKVSSTGETSVITSFDGSNGSAPNGGLIRGADGNYYGTTSNGGIGTSVVNGASTFYYGGTVFRMTAAGGITTLVDFTGPNGINPAGKLVIGPDGNFYGTTLNGGATLTASDLGKGTIFKMTPGGALSTLVRFNGSNGAGPLSLTVGRDGNFYGVTSSGGASNTGTIFRMQPSGALMTLVHFDGTKGHLPTGLVYGADGNLYGTTNYGGANHYGTLFRMTHAGAFTTLANFNLSTGRNPTSPMTLLPDGNFMGATADGIFKATPSGSITHLVTLDETTGTLNSGLAWSPDGYLYGTTGSGGGAGSGTIFKVNPAGELTLLSDFHNPDGNSPRAGLTAGPYSRLYGTTEFGGIANKGTIFSITPTGELETLMDFDGSNGMFPHAELTPDPDGNFYGSTFGNATPATSYPAGFLIHGSIFRMTPYSDEFSTLVTFDKSNGTLPSKALIRGMDGNFYGTTGGGPWVNHSGSLFRMTPQGDLTTLVEFDYSTSGRFPSGKLAADAEGNLYGTTTDGGTSLYGTVFKINPAGDLTILANFNGSNGRNPQGVVVDAAGNLYGTTGSGTSPNSEGTVFRITNSGTFSTLLKFNKTSHGSHPGRLTLGPDEYLYGVASFGGTSATNGQTGSGTVFRISPAGAFTALHHFDGATGRSPNDELVFGPDGHLYGTTLAGGGPPEAVDIGSGVIYRMHFGPEVVTLPPSPPFLPDVTLNATVDPHGYDTSVSFQIGTDPWMNDVSTISGGVVPAGNSIIAVQAVASGLQPDTTYYVRAVASNAENPVPQMGEIQILSTQAVLMVEAPAGIELANGSGKVDFGKATIGKSTVRPVSLGNGSEGVNLDSIHVFLGGSDASSFSVMSAPPASIGIGQAETFSLRFSPKTSGEKSAVLSITSNDPNADPFQIQLIGTATVAEPEIAVQQPLGSNLTDGISKRSFGIVDVRKGGSAKIFTIRNTGTAALGSLSIRKDGRNRNDFIIGALPKNSIPPGGRITFKVTFKPTGKGTRNAAIHIKSDDADEDPFDIKLSGMGSGS